MIGLIENLFSSKTSRKKPSLAHRSHTAAAAREPDRAAKSFIRPFRWQAPPGGTAQPDSVEVVGSFTEWKRVPMAYDKPTKTWHVTLHNVSSNRTHHYVLLVDGKAAYDPTCDGLSVPHGPHEGRWPIPTEKGPRVMLLFGQAK